MTKWYRIFICCLTLTYCSRWTTSQQIAHDEISLVPVDACRDDYAPCSCRMVPTGGVMMEVTCQDVDVDSVQSVFRTGVVRDIMKLRLSLQSSNSFVPADVFADKVVHYIELVCSPASTPLQIHPEAFRASYKYGEVFQIKGCNLSQMDYGYLKDFTALHTLSLHNFTSMQSSSMSLPTSLNSLIVADSSDFYSFSGFPVSAAWTSLTINQCVNFNSFTGLPSLPALKSLSVTGCPKVTQWDVFRTQQFPELTDIDLSNCQLEDPAVEDILKSIVSSSMAKKLTALSLENNRMTRIPRELSRLPQLTELLLDNNYIVSLESRSLVLTAPKLSLISLSGNGLKVIEPGAFQGDFSEAKIDLRQNSLLRLDSSVFRALLEQMTGQAPDKNSAQLLVYKNPIKCDGCDMAWLIRDHRNLLDRFQLFPLCSNGTDFLDLDPIGYKSCELIEEATTIATSPPDISQSKPLEEDINQPNSTPITTVAPPESKNDAPSRSFVILISWAICVVLALVLFD